MNVGKRYVLTMILFFEGVVVGYFFLRGPQGICTIIQSKHSQQYLLEQAEQLERTLASLHDEIDQWDRDWFLREKFAREHLGMARPGDLVYSVD